MDTIHHDDGQLLTVREAGARLRLSTAKIYELMAAGQLKFCKFGKSRRIPLSAITQLVNRHTVEPVKK